MYTFPDGTEPIRQGDIFRWLPKVELLLGDEGLPILTYQEEGGARVIDWFQFIETGGYASTNVIVKPAYGIVITQDCDAGRAQNIAFCEIKPFTEIEINCKEDSKPKTVVGIVTDQSRKNQKWYYLAPNERLGFATRMGVDFLSIFEVNRVMLDNNKDKLRLGRLCDDVAWPHFRERVAEFFRRYPYNEWYPFNTDEVHAYEERQHKPVDFFYPWQADKS